jgi:hypothetical protein
MRIQGYCLLAALVLFISGSAYTQSIEVTPEQGLGLALEYANQGNADTLMLTGGIYEMNEAVSIVSPITIMAKEGLTEKPMIRPAPGDSIDRFFGIRHDFTLLNVILDGRCSDGTYNYFGGKNAIAIRNTQDGSGPTKRPDFNANGVVIRNIYRGDPETATLGHAFRVEGGGLADTVHIENSLFYNLGDEAIIDQKIGNYPEEERTNNAMIIKNCTFYNVNNGGVNSVIKYVGDKDTTTADPYMVFENLTFYDCKAWSIYIREVKNTIARNIIIHSPTVISNDLQTRLIHIERDGSVISHVDTFNVAPAMDVENMTPFRATDGTYTGAGMGIVDSTTIYGFDPQFVDAPDGDFTLAAGSAVCNLAHDGGALGDRQWATNCTGTGIDEAVPSHIPDTFVLAQNFPNPFNPITTIQYTIFKKSSIKLQIIDITGSLVETLVDGQRSAGVYSVTWDASKLSSGMYFYKIIADGKTAVKKMLFVK